MVLFSPLYCAYFVIDPSVSFFFSFTLTGLRFLRALRLMTVPDILQYLNVLKTSSSIRLAQLVSIFISVSLTAAGLIHLVSFIGLKNITRSAYSTVRVSTVQYSILLLVLSFKLFELCQFCMCVAACGFLENLCIVFVFISFSQVETKLCVIFFSWWRIYCFVLFCDMLKKLTLYGILFFFTNLRFTFSACSPIDDCSGHITIPFDIKIWFKHSSNSTAHYFRFRISYGGWVYTFGEWL